ncbi:MAG: molybdopterin-dependent oxidoreductase, partial [bacterium]
MSEGASTTCPYCGVGCGVDAKVVDNRDIIAVSGSPDHPANFGRLCVKGSALHETTGLEGRLLYPQIGGQRVAWESALDTVASGFQKIIREHGPNSVAFYLSGQLLTEDYYVANKLMKGFIGSANVDTNSRLCMASAVAGYKRAFGADAVPNCYEDLEHCDLLVVTGSNAAWTHPVLYQRIVAAKARRPEMKVVVIDPRLTATCDIADIHLPVNPGSDAFLFAGL